MTRPPVRHYESFKPEFVRRQDSRAEEVAAAMRMLAKIAHDPDDLILLSDYLGLPVRVPELAQPPNTP